EQGRQDGVDPRAVSAWLLCQGLRWPHRRSERGLEGPWPMGRQRRPHTMADRRWQGNEAARGALPAAARSAGALSERGNQPGASQGALGFLLPRQELRLRYRRSANEARNFATFPRRAPVLQFPAPIAGLRFAAEQTSLPHEQH